MTIRELPNDSDTYHIESYLPCQNPEDEKAAFWMLASSYKTLAEEMRESTKVKQHDVEQNCDGCGEKRICNYMGEALHGYAVCRDCYVSLVDAAEEWADNHPEQLLSVAL